MFSKIVLRAYKLLSLVATKYLESYLTALKRRRSYLEGEIQHIESENRRPRLECNTHKQL